MYLIVQLNMRDCGTDCHVLGTVETREEAVGTIDKLYDDIVPSLARLIGTDTGEAAKHAEMNRTDDLSFFASNDACILVCAQKVNSNEPIELK